MYAGTTLYLTPDPEKQAAFRMRKCVKGEGMPLLKNSMLKGNLFIEIEIEFPDKLDKKACDVLYGFVFLHSISRAFFSSLAQ